MIYKYGKERIYYLYFPDTMNRKRLNQDVDEDTFSYKMAKLAEEEENAKHVLKLKIGTYLSVNFASFSS